MDRISRTVHPVIAQSVYLLLVKYTVGEYVVIYIYSAQMFSFHKASQD